MNFLSVVTSVAFVFVMAASARAQSSTDLWDVSNGVTVTANSRLDDGGYSIYDMFGGYTPTAFEPGHVVFSDGLGDGNVDFVEWETPAPVLVGLIRLFHDDDYPGNNWRNLKGFRAYGWDAVKEHWDILAFTSLPVQIGEGKWEGTVETPSPYNRFRAEFVRAASSDIYSDGPRIVELDAFPPRLCAEFVSENLPSSPLVAGQTYAARITMRNNGQTAWTSDTVSLVSESSPRNANWGLSAVPLAVNEVIQPGQSKTFAFSFTSPTSTGTFPFQWRLYAKRGFGDYSPLKALSVELKPFASRFLDQSIPATVKPGAKFQVSVRMRNVGTDVWHTDAVSLVPVTSDMAQTWSTNGSALIADTSPFQGATFTVDCVAPTATGRYKMSWRLQRAGFGQFGDASFEQTIRVAP